MWKINEMAKSTALDSKEPGSEPGVYTASKRLNAPQAADFSSLTGK